MVLTLSVYIHISVVRSESSYKLDPEMSVLLEIRIERASKTLHPGDIVKGVVAITSKSALKVSLGTNLEIDFPQCHLLIANNLITFILTLITLITFVTLINFIILITLITFITLITLILITFIFIIHILILTRENMWP